MGLRAFILQWARRATPFEKGNKKKVSESACLFCQDIPQTGNSLNREINMATS